MEVPASMNASLDASQELEISGTYRFLINWKLGADSFSLKGRKGRVDLQTKIFKVHNVKNYVITLKLRYDSGNYFVVFENNNLAGAYLEYAYFVAGHGVFCLAKCEQFNFPAKWLTRSDVSDIPNFLHGGQVVLNCMVKLSIHARKQDGLSILEEVSVEETSITELQNPNPYVALKPDYDLEDQIIENFLYNGEIPCLNICRALELLRRCRRRKIQELEAICVQHCLHNLTERDVLNILKLSTDLNIEDLTRECLHFIKSECRIIYNEEYPDILV